jgi:Kdo2-lipid IVA lauroyltransferase/acyltransferase
VAAVSHVTTRAAPAAIAAAPRWYAHGFNRAAVYRVATLAASVLPRPARLRVAAGMANVASRRFPAERAVVRRNLARILPGAPDRELNALVAAVFRNFAVCFADLITANRRADVATLVAGIEGMTELTKAARAGRGLVVLTAHLGNWELAGRMLARDGARPTHVVVAEEADPAVERFLRGGEGPVRFVTTRTPTTSLGLLTALRRGEIVALQGDRALGTRGDISHTFFGAPARFPMGPFVLARAARSPVVPAFCLLDGDRRYRIVVGSPSLVKAGDEAAALGRWVATLETMVRRHPTQWFNFYDLWSSPA